MATDSAVHSRRALLGVAAGAVGGSVLGAFGRPTAALAGDGANIVQGEVNTGTATTRVEVNGSVVGADALVGAVTADNYGSSAVKGTHAGTTYPCWGVFGETASVGGRGVEGKSTAASGPTSGVYGSVVSSTGRAVEGHAGGGAALYGISVSGPGLHVESTSGRAVEATSSTGMGVYGTSTADYGVQGTSQGDAGVRGNASVALRPGVLGFSSGGIGSGVQGIAGNDAYVDAPAKTGVYGFASQDAASRGVHGRSTAGRGVYGQATTGVAGYFSTPKPTGAVHTGIALQAVGRVKFDRCVGIAVIVNGASASAAISPGIDLTSTSVVTATLMGSAGGTVTVHRVAVNATANAFTIFLTGPVTTTSVKVGWHVFG